MILEVVLLGTCDYSRIFFVSAIVTHLLHPHPLEKSPGYATVEFLNVKPGGTSRNR
jgi:hypothetical protein